MPIEVFDGVTDAKKWRSVLGSLPVPMQDVYFWPEWVRLHRFQSGALAIMFTYQEANDVWAYPFLLQPITHIGEHALEQTWFDIETAYGYGGPLASTEEGGFLAEAHSAFAEWCQGWGVVAEFVRLHPLLQNEHWLDPQVEIVYDRETVSLRLREVNSGELPYSSTAQNMLRRAERARLHVRAYPVYDHFDQFVTFYLCTMDRVQADRYYYFNEEYFRGLRQLIQETGWLLVAQQDEEWIATAVFLKGPVWLHYHLSASNPDKRVPGATNQILHAAAQIGSQDGLEQLHLGGGRTSKPDDSLLKFKRSMATDSQSFYIGKRIHNQEVYASLRAIWEQQYPSLAPKYGQRVLFYRYTRVQQ